MQSKANVPDETVGVGRKVSVRRRNYITVISGVSQIGRRSTCKRLGPDILVLCVL